MANNTFGKEARRIQKAILSSSAKALNKALTATNKKVRKELRDATGLSNKALDKRVLMLRPQKGKLNGSINIATKFGVQYAEFSPKEKKLKAVVENAYSPNGVAKRAYKMNVMGTTIKVGNQPRQLLPGAFIRTVSSGKEIVLGHKDTMSPTGDYRKGRTRRTDGWSTTPRSPVLDQAGRALRSANQIYLRTLIKQYFDEEVAKALSK
jgi:hypothetical protein